MAARPLALLVSALAVFLIAAADDPYTSKPGNFRAMFPSAPKASRLNTTGPGGQKVTAHSYSARDRDGAAYSVNYADYPAPTEAMLDAAVDAMIKSAKMQTKSREAI